MKVMLVGGINDKKAAKISKAIKDNCGKDIETVFVNIFTQKPEEEAQNENPDLIVLFNKQKYNFTQPAIDGLGLIYPQMGQKKVFEEIKKYANK